MKSCSPEKIILGHLSISSLKNRFDSLKHTIRRNVDIALISKTKLDSAFTSAQFRINEFSAPFSFDRNIKVGGLLMYIREDIPSRQLFCKSQCYIDLRLYLLKSILKKEMIFKWVI